MLQGNWGRKRVYLEAGLLSSGMKTEMKISVIHFHNIYFSDKFVYASMSDSIRAAEIGVTSIDSPTLLGLFVGPAQLLFTLVTQP